MACADGLEDGREDQIGGELGRGVRSVVYAYGTDEVIKVADPGTPEAWLTEELRLADAAARSGAPTPTGRRAVSLRGRVALVSHRIDGLSMWEALRREPHRAADFGRVLGEVQTRVWSCVPSYELPQQRQRVESKIRAAAVRYGADLLVALDLVPDESGPAVLCHGDLHPRNVLLAEVEPMLVDWFDASRGSATADAARTEVVLRASADLDPSVPPGLAPTLDVVLNAYRAHVETDRRYDSDLMTSWRLVQRVARLAEGFGAAGVARLRAELAAARAAPS